MISKVLPHVAYYDYDIECVMHENDPLFFPCAVFVPFKTLTNVKCNSIDSERLLSVT